MQLVTTSQKLPLERSLKQLYRGIREIVEILGHRGYTPFGDISCCWELQPSFFRVKIYVNLRTHSVHLDLLNFKLAVSHTTGKRESHLKIHRIENIWNFLLRLATLKAPCTLNVWKNTVVCLLTWRLIKFYFYITRNYTLLLLPRDY